MHSHKLKSQIRKKKSLSVQKTHRLHSLGGSGRTRVHVGGPRTQSRGVPSLGDTLCLASRACHLGKERAAPFPVPSSLPALPASMYPCILTHPSCPATHPASSPKHARPQTCPRPRASASSRLGQLSPAAHPAPQERVPPRGRSPSTPGWRRRPGRRIR